MESFISRMESFISRKGLGNWQVSLLLAGFMAALVGLSAGTVMAADLYGGAAVSRSGSPYDDPRYSAIYGNRLSESDVARLSRRNGDRFGGRRYDYSSSDSSSSVAEARMCDRPQRDVYRSSRTYGSTEPPGYANRCLQKSAIRQHLRDDGWFAFEIIRVEPDYAILQAHKDDGARYQIRVDRCSGDILGARLLDRSYANSDYGVSGNRDGSRSY